MADEVEMTPVDAAEPPKADPLAKPAAPKPATLKLEPVKRVPAADGALKPGLKLPPKPGAAMRPGLKLPTQNALKPGLKLPPKPDASASALKPGLKLPTQNALKPGLKLPTQNALKPGLKLPQKPVIRKPGEVVAASPLPKPVLPKPVVPEASAAASSPAPAAQPTAPKPMSVDAQGVGKLPTVEAKAVGRDDVAPVAAPGPSPLEQLKSVTQKLKGVTQEIPQQAILRKTGIIAEDAMSEAQKAAAKHKTARISLSDAMGVAPVKNENAPLKTIRIKRPIDLPGSTAALKPQPKPVAAGTADAAAPVPPPAVASAPDEGGSAKTPTVTQRKTLKISRPSGAVRPAGKFGIKKPAAAAPAAETKAPPAGGDAAQVADIPDIADIPDMSSVPPPNVPAAAADNGSSWVWTLSALVQFAACVVIGALAFFLYKNTQTQYF